MPDLPCGGADLQTDDFNCGECGKVCAVKAGGTEYEVGGCVAGVCGANTWKGQEWLEPTPLTCAEVCAKASFGELSCQVNGCSELALTAFVCESIFGQPCLLAGSVERVMSEFSGACDEPLPWPDAIEEGTRNVFCCCG